MWTPSTPRLSKKWPSWCLPWRQCRCPAAWVFSTSEAKREGTCSLFSPGTDWVSTRSCGEIRVIGAGRLEHGYLCRWTWRHRTLYRSVWTCHVSFMYIVLHLTPKEFHKAFIFLKDPSEPTAVWSVVCYTGGDMSILLMTKTFLLVSQSTMIMNYLLSNIIKSATNCSCEFWPSV